ncbi:MAG: hypothetical protein ACRC3G_06990 [Bacteroidales bacterium]
MRICVLFFFLAFCNVLIGKEDKKKSRIHNIEVSNLHQEWLRDARVDILKFIGKPADKSLMDKTLKTFVHYYENNGYPFAWAQFDSVQIDSLSWSAKFNCDKGNRIVIDTLIIKGDVRLRPKFLRNHLNLRKPKLYSETYVRSIDRQLKSLDFLRTTQPSAVEFRAHQASVFVWIEKEKSNYANGLLAFYSDDNGKLKLQGEADIFFANIFGGGEQFSLTWSSPSSSLQLLNVVARVPYLIAGSIGTEGVFQMQRIDSLHITVGGKFRLFSKLNSITTASVFASLHKYNNGAHDAEFARVSTNLYGVGVEISTTDKKTFTREGYFTQFNVAGGLRKAQGEIDERSTHIDIDATATYWHNYKRLSTIFNVQFCGKYLIGTESGLTLGELHTLGGSSTLRGFNEHSIFTSQYALASIEPRYFFNSQIYASVFGDYAMVRRVEPNTHSQLFGIGFGTAFSTIAGIFSLSYAVGTEFGQALSFRGSKVHLRYIVLF